MHAHLQECFNMSVESLRLRDGSQISRELLEETVNNLRVALDASPEKNSFDAWVELLRKCESLKISDCNRSMNSSSTTLLRDWKLIDENGDTPSHVKQVVMNCIEKIVVSYKRCECDEQRPHFDCSCLQLDLIDPRDPLPPAESSQLCTIS